MLELVKYPNFPLLQECAAWDFRWERDPKSGLTLREITAQMLQVMYDHRGVGLAANQVGIPLRIFVADKYAGTQTAGHETLVAVNPELSDLEGRQSGREGCLSVHPGISWPVARAASVHLKAYDINGKPFEGDAEGFEARILQHECDHLAGVCCIDKTDRYSRAIAMKKWGKVKRDDRRPPSGPPL
jgi:peptide deformylase